MTLLAQANHSLRRPLHRAAFRAAIERLIGVSRMVTKGKGPADYRSAKSGRFVTEGYGKRHPNTTVKEHNRPPTKRK